MRSTDCKGVIENDKFTAFLYQSRSEIDSERANLSERLRAKVRVEVGVVVGMIAIVIVGIGVRVEL